MQLLVQVLYVCTAVVLVAAARYAIRLLSTRYYLRHVPGPKYSFVVFSRGRI